MPWPAIRIPQQQITLHRWGRGTARSLTQTLRPKLNSSRPMCLGPCCTIATTQVCRKPGSHTTNGKRAHMLRTIISDNDKAYRRGRVDGRGRRCRGGHSLSPQSQQASQMHTSEPKSPKRGQMKQPKGALRIVDSWSNWHPF